MYHHRRADNHGLTDVPYVLAAGRVRWKFLFALIVLIIAVAAISAGLALRYVEPPVVAVEPLPSPSPRLEALERENHELREALARVRFELEVELATRNELERQVQSLNEQLGQLREELAFIKSAAGRENGK